MFTIKNDFTGQTKEFENYEKMQDLLLLQRAQSANRPMHWYPVLEKTFLSEIELDFQFDLQHVVNFYTDFFPVTIECSGISTLVIPGRTIPIVKGGKMLLDLEDIPQFNAEDACLRSENNPAVLKGYLPQINKIRENVFMEDVDFELFGIWTGWFEDFVKKENPALADRTAFLRSFDRWALADPDSFETTFQIDWGTFFRADVEHYKLIHKILPGYPGTDSPAGRL